MSKNLLPKVLAEEVERKVGKVYSFKNAAGGCINNGGVIKTSLHEYFIKWNSRSRFPGMFEAESKGLRLLRRAEGVRVPEVVSDGIAGDYIYLILELLPSASRTSEYWEIFATGLVRIHSSSNSEFGLDHDNFIGSLPQPNHPYSSWSEFFLNQRLLFQLKSGVDMGRIQTSERKILEESILGLEKLIPEEKPALLHGDMWGGNLITGPGGEPCLIDPAVYFGHREMDLAMSQLFGGFDSKYITFYNEQFPLEPGYRERFDLWNLYPLLVHVNLFGGGYLAQVKSILKSFQ